jgi:hypothetical protein
MPKVQMLAHITGGRADGTAWPAAGDPLKVSDAEAHDLYVAQLARPWPGGDEDEQNAEAAAAAATQAAVEASVPPVQSPPDEPVREGYDPDPEPAPVAAEPETAEPESPGHVKPADAGPADDDPPRPAASKAEWAQWSRKNGASDEWASAATKQQMMEQYGSRP